MLLLFEVVKIRQFQNHSRTLWGGVRTRFVFMMICITDEASEEKVAQARSDYNGDPKINLIRHHHQH